MLLRYSLFLLISFLVCWRIYILATLLFTTTVLYIVINGWNHFMLFHFHFSCVIKSCQQNKNTIIYRAYYTHLKQNHKYNISWTDTAHYCSTVSPTICINMYKIVLQALQSHIHSKRKLLLGYSSIIYYFKFSHSSWYCLSMSNICLFFTIFFCSMFYLFCFIYYIYMICIETFSFVSCLFNLHTDTALYWKNKIKIISFFFLGVCKVFQHT